MLHILSLGPGCGVSPGAKCDMSSRQWSSIVCDICHYTRSPSTYSQWSCSGPRGRRTGSPRRSCRPRTSRRCRPRCSWPRPRPRRRRSAPHSAAAGGGCPLQVFLYKCIVKIFEVDKNILSSDRFICVHLCERWWRRPARWPRRRSTAACSWSLRCFIWNIQEINIYWLPSSDNIYQRSVTHNNMSHTALCYPLVTPPP